MAEPFSIAVGTIGLLDVCWRVGSYLKEIEASAGKVEEEIVLLSREITSLISVNELIQRLEEAVDGVAPGNSLNYESLARKLWAEVDANTEGCRASVQKLEELLKEIIGKYGPKVANKWDGIKKQLRNQQKSGELVQIHHRLSKYQASLHTLLAALNV